MIALSRVHLERNIVSIMLVSMLLLPLVCVVVRSAKQFRLQCTLESSSITSNTFVLKLIYSIRQNNTQLLLIFCCRSANNSRSCFRFCARRSIIFVFVLVFVHANIVDDINFNFARRKNQKQLLMATNCSLCRPSDIICGDLRCRAC